MQTFALTNPAFDCVVEYQTAIWGNRYALIFSLDQAGGRQGSLMKLTKQLATDADDTHEAAEPWLATYYAEKGVDPLSGFVSSFHHSLKYHIITAMTFSDKALEALTLKEILKINRRITLLNALNNLTDTLNNLATTTATLPTPTAL